MHQVEQVTSPEGGRRRREFVASFPDSDRPADDVGVAHDGVDRVEQADSSNSSTEDDAVVSRRHSLPPSAMVPLMAAFEFTSSNVRNIYDSGEEGLWRHLRIGGDR